MRRGYARDEVRVAESVEHCDEPQVARAPVQHAEEQADQENRREHRDRGRKRQREVVPVQRPERVQHVRGDDAGVRAPAAHELGLQQPAVYELLVEAEEQEASIPTATLQDLVERASALSAAAVLAMVNEE